MRRKDSFRYVIGTLLCVSLMTGGTGLAAFAEDFSAGPDSYVELSGLPDSGEAESVGQAEGSQVTRELPPEDAAAGTTADEKQEEAPDVLPDGDAEKVPDGMTEDGTPEEAFPVPAEDGTPEEAFPVPAEDGAPEEALNERPIENPVEKEATENKLPDDLPAVRELTYTGEAQELLDASGIPEDSFYYYSLNGETYGTVVPTGTDAGAYTVYVKTADAAEAVVLAVTIAKADVIFTPPAAIH